MAYAGKWVLLGCGYMFYIWLALPAKITADRSPCLFKLDLLLPGAHYEIPQSVPTGANVCNRTCYDQSECTYSFTETFQASPLLLFRCQCLGGCPPKKILFGDFMVITCRNVSNAQSRCTCPDTQEAHQCDFDSVENPRRRPFYCACCERQNDTRIVT